MILYFFPLSQNSIKVLAIIRYLNLSVDEHIVDLTRGDQQTPELLALNPNGRMPILKDGTFVLWESNAIMQYLAATAKSELYSQIPKIQADLNRWLFWETAHWGAAVSAIFFEKFGPHRQPNLERIAKSEERLKRHAALLNAHLKNRDFLLGNQISIADFAIASFAPYRFLAALPLQAFTHIGKWLERIETLKCWSEAVPDLSKVSPK